MTFANVPNSDPAIGSDEASSAALVNLYDSLIFPTSSGGIVPDLTTSWTVSSNGLTYTFNLRSGVTFHNGDPLTAMDVVFSMNRLLNMSQGYSYLFSPYVESITASSNSQVVINLKSTFGPFLSALARLYILDESQVVAHEVSGSYVNHTDYGSTWLLTHDAGSGAYYMVSANLESNMVFGEYKSYWNGTNPNQPQYVQYYGTSASSTVEALFDSHQIQITDQWQPYSIIQSLAKDSGAKMVTIPTVNEMYLMLNTQKAPTDDIYVREAMSYALNYSAIIDNIFQGSQPSSGPVTSVLPGHDSNIPVSHQDLSLAQQLIQKSRYYSDGKFNGPAVQYYWVTAVPSEQSLALEFQSDMAKIGVSVNVVGTPWLSVVNDLANETSSPNIVSIEDGASYFEAGSLLQSRYTSASQGTWEQNEWLNNQTLTNQIYAALSIQNQTQRFQAYNTIQTEIYNMYPTIYAFDVYEVRAYYPGVVNWYAANGHPNPNLGYDFVLRDIGFSPSALAALG
jgi:peptide/nickel transport system substrate-binding protein